MILTFSASYCSPGCNSSWSSFIKFQGYTGREIEDMDLIWVLILVFADDCFSRSSMQFQCHAGQTKSLGQPQLSYPSDLPCSQCIYCLRRDLSQPRYVVVFLMMYLPATCNTWLSMVNYWRLKRYWCIRRIYHGKRLVFNWSCSMVAVHQSDWLRNLALCKMNCWNILCLHILNKSDVFVRNCTMTMRCVVDRTFWQPICIYMIT